MTYSCSGTPNTWLGSGGLWGGDVGGWLLGFMDALNFLSYLAQKHIIALHTFLDKHFGGIAGWGGRLWTILLASCLERDLGLSGNQDVGWAIHQNTSQWMFSFYSLLRLERKRWGHSNSRDYIVQQVALWSNPFRRSRVKVCQILWSLFEPICGRPGVSSLLLWWEAESLPQVCHACYLFL